MHPTVHLHLLCRHPALRLNEIFNVHTVNPFTRTAAIILATSTEKNRRNRGRPRFRRLQGGTCITAGTRPNSHRTQGVKISSQFDEAERNLPTLGYNCTGRHRGERKNKQTTLGDRCGTTHDSEVGHFLEALGSHTWHDRMARTSCNSFLVEILLKSCPLRSPSFSAA